MLLKPAHSNSCLHIKVLDLYKRKRLCTSSFKLLLSLCNNFYPTRPLESWYICCFILLEYNGERIRAAHKHLPCPARTWSISHLVCSSIVALITLVFFLFLFMLLGFRLHKKKLSSTCTSHALGKCAYLCGCTQVCAHITIHPINLKFCRYVLLCY
jgi:hypothetical protein